jgi:hypothetical protein
VLRILQSDDLPEGVYTAFVRIVHYAYVDNPSCIQYKYIKYV